MGDDDPFIHFQQQQPHHQQKKNSTPPRIFDRFAFDSSSDEDDGNDFNINNNNNRQTIDALFLNDAVSSSSKRLDNMLDFLDRKLLLNNNTPQNPFSSSSSDSPLPEFVGRGGGIGIFTVPVRAAVHPNRPPCLELRPHPLRETHTRCFLRTLLATSCHLWAGSENSVRFWDYKDAYKSLYKSDDDDFKECDSAPFIESAHGVPGTMCMVSDEASRCVWTGHKDGWIRCWKFPSSGCTKTSRSTASSPTLKEYLSWEAHRVPVLSLIVSSCGDIWSCSEGGIIKIWPWEAIERALSVPSEEERHMASLTVKRSYIDLRNQLTLAGYSNTFPSDIRLMLSDPSRAKVWTASSVAFALWDARTRELLKVFNIDGQIDRAETSASQDSSVELISGSKKDKISQSTFGFFQRSRNAIIGAADAVRRVAAKGGFVDDNQRIESLVATVDGMIWTGCTNGLLIQWDGYGNRIQDFHYHSSAVVCFCTFGPRLWVGYASGTIQVLDLEGKFLGQWVAHSSPVIKMAVGSGYVFTLANHGGIRGWNFTSPSPLDEILRSELAGKEFLYTRIENVRILTGTWNVGQGRASQESLKSWIGSAASDAGIVAVGLQEVDMGAGFLALSAAKETVGLEGSSVGQWWLDEIGKTLGEGSTFERVGSRQLAGLLIAVWVRNNIRSHVGDVDAAAVPCGFGRAIGNKGAVGLRIRVYGRILCFVNCHFAAHLEAVSRRNADFDHVYRTMAFSRPSNLFTAAAVGASSAVQMTRGTNTTGSNSVDGMPDLSEADMVVFLGDLNYRLHGISFDEARDFVLQRCFDWLRGKDQLRAEMEAGNAFQGMREADIRFPPTYKFVKHQAGLGGYDSGEKKRIPAWCDRILYRDSRSNMTSECSLGCPVVSTITQYESCMDVTDSDHKPVRCKFSVDIARVDESVRRQEFGEIIQSNETIKYMLENLSKIPETVVSTNNILLQNQDTSILRITNKCGKSDAFFEIICEGQSTVREDCQASEQSSRGSFGFPRWLEVNPAAGIIKPENIAEVSVHHEQYQTVEEYVDGVSQNSWCEDSRDKEVILLVKVRGSFSTNTRNHRIRVRHCFSAKTKKAERKSENATQQIPGNLLHRADLQWLSGSYDVVDHLRNLHTP